MSAEAVRKIDENERKKFKERLDKLVKKLKANNHYSSEDVQREEQIRDMLEQEDIIPFETLLEINRMIIDFEIAYTRD